MIFSDFECIFDPFDSRFAVGAIDGDDIETTGDFRSYFMVRKIALGGRRQSSLFVAVDAFHPAAEECIASPPDLDEDQALVVAHHQIDLPLAASIIASDGNESFFCQPAFGERLRGPADPIGKEALHDSEGESVVVLSSSSAEAESVFERKSVISRDPRSESLPISRQTIGTPS